MEQQCQYTRDNCPFLRKYKNCRYFHPLVEENSSISHVYQAKDQTQRLERAQQQQSGNSKYVRKDEAQQQPKEENKGPSVHQDTFKTQTQRTNNEESKTYKPKLHNKPGTLQEDTILNNEPLKDHKNLYKSKQTAPKTQQMQQNVTQQLDLKAEDADLKIDDFKQNQQKQNHFKKACQYGDTCWKYKKGTCTYLHQTQIQQKPSQIQKEINNLPSKQLQQNVASSTSSFRSKPGRPHFSETKGTTINDNASTQSEPAAVAIPHGGNKVIFFSKQQIETLSGKEVIDIKQDLVNQGPSFLARLNGTRLDEDYVSYLLTILSKLIQDKGAQISMNLISVFVESQFMKKLSDWIKANSIKPVGLITKKLQYCQICIKIMNSLLDMFPQKLQSFPITEVFNEASILYLNPKLNEEQKVSLQQECTSLLQKYHILVSEQQIEQQEEKKKSSKKQIQEDDSYKKAPEEDFKQVDVIPGERELRQEREEAKKLLRAMPKKGDLISSHNYLDIVFRLLQEDAVADLRDGVTLISRFDRTRLSKKEFRQKLRTAQIKLHENLTIDSLEVLEGSAVIQFRLQTNKARFLDWRISKKLLPGSLIILSADEFENIIIGIIKNRNAQQMNYTHTKFGYVPLNIQLVKATEAIDSLQNFVDKYAYYSFTMIESGAYFESYKHVLGKIQEMDSWEELPLSKYYVQGKSEPSVPTYIQQIVRQNPQFNAGLQNLGLDESQLKALQGAFNNDLSLIQGPPGTGKTFIGVQIVKILLKYKKYWLNKGPILLVTYTNHALNQFLMFVKEFTKKIVRIGGKKEEALEQFDFRKLMREHGTQFIILLLQIFTFSILKLRALMPDSIINSFYKLVKCIAPQLV